MRTTKCDYGIEDETNCNICISECALNKNPDAETKRKENLDLINEYKRKLNLYNAIKGGQYGKFK